MAAKNTVDDFNFKVPMYKISLALLSSSRCALSSLVEPDTTVQHRLLCKTCMHKQLHGDSDRLETSPTL